MGEVSILVKNNLVNTQYSILGDDKRKTRITMIIAFLIISTLFAEYGLVKMFNDLKAVNGEIVLLNLIVNIVGFGAVLMAIPNIMNRFYLASDWREMLVYPIKTRSLPLSKYVFCAVSSSFIPIYSIIPLVTYGILTNANFLYYIYVALFELATIVVSAAYIILITLTIFWIISIVKSPKVNSKSNKLILVVDLVVAGLTYILLKNSFNGNLNLGNFLFNIFLRENISYLTSSEAIGLLTNYALLFSIALVTYLGLYLVGGDVYLTIMKSGLFNSKDSKKIGVDLDENEFKLKGPIVSNIIRDIKIIFRVPALRSNCITGNGIYAAVTMTLIILLKDKLAYFFEVFEGTKSTIVIFIFLFLSITNFIPITSFSREGISLNSFKVFPIDNKKFLISKICVAILGNILAFITTSILIILISSSFIEFILLEIVLIVYTIFMPMILISIDLRSMDLKWINIKDIFLTQGVKVLVTWYIITFIVGAYMFISNILGIGNEYLCVLYSIFTVFAYSALSFRKTIKKMKKSGF